MDSAGPARRTSGRVRTKESTAAGIYGVIVSAAVMASAHAARAVALIVAVLVTLVVYWAAERYARIIAERIHEGHRPSWPQVRHQLTTGWEIVTTSALPLAVLALLSVLGMELSEAVLWSLACSTALLCLAGWEIGLDGRLSRRERLLSAAAAGTFGLAMVALKAFLH